MKIILHTILFIFTFGLIFIWLQTPALEDFTVQGLALVVLIYLITAFIRKKRNPNAELFGNAFDIFMLTVGIFILISITGNLYSPLFFLVYFLGFGITFIFEPVSVFTFTIGTILVFLPEAMKNLSPESFIRLGSVVLISPLAYFFGQEYTHRMQEQEKMKAMNERLKETANTIAKDVEAVLKKEQKNMDAEDVEKINEILEETEDLRQEAKE